MGSRFTTQLLIFQTFELEEWIISALPMKYWQGVWDRHNLNLTVSSFNVQTCNYQHLGDAVSKTHTLGNQQIINLLS